MQERNNHNKHTHKFNFQSDVLHEIRYLFQILCLVWNCHYSTGKIQHRYVFALMASTGLAITYGLKVNFHVCIVAMINHTALLQNSPNKSLHKDEGTCHPNHDENGTDVVDGHLMEVSEV